MTLSSIRKNALPWFGRFLELRLRAFVYALFTLVGFLLGVIVTCNLAASMFRAALS